MIFTDMVYLGHKVVTMSLSAVVQAWLRRFEWFEVPCPLPLLLELRVCRGGETQ